MAVECATLDVPLKRDDPAHKEKISLRVIRLPANTPHPASDPFVMLAGGPGQAASALAPFAAAQVEIRRTRDILLIDQRGTGQSAPLQCATLDDADDTTLQEALTLEIVSRVQRCHEELREQNRDPLDYGTLHFVADLDDVRRALGVDTMNIWASSYGTRVALEYLRRHPEHVRTMVLDGVVDPSISIPTNGWQTRKERLQAVLDACAQSESCRTLWPPPQEALTALVLKLRAPGINAYIENPNTGVVETVTIDSDLVLAAMQSLLYAPETAALLPYVLSRATYHEDFTPLMAVTRAFSGKLEGQINPALHYAIICSEDRQVSDALLNDPLVGTLYQQSVEACAPWPIAPDAHELHAPVHNQDVPVLLLSGALDPVTPPAYAEQVAATLQQHRTLTAPGYGHILSMHSCVPSLIAAFVKTADLQQLPENCVQLLEESTPPFFWPDALAPQP
jgi:Predicted hydrolases or acyltransferases (alpha/beta hydrolase superfamily)